MGFGEEKFELQHILAFLPASLSLSFSVSPPHTETTTCLSVCAEKTNLSVALMQTWKSNIGLLFKANDYLPSTYSCKTQQSFWSLSVHRFWPAQLHVASAVRKNWDAKDNFLLVFNNSSESVMLSWLPADGGYNSGYVLGFSYSPAVASGSSGQVGHNTHHAHTRARERTHTHGPTVFGGRRNLIPNTWRQMTFLW